MGPTVRSHLARYGMALVAFLLALVVRLLLDPLLGERLPYLFFAVAVVVVAWHDGFGPSLLTVFLSLFAGTYFLHDPRYSLFVSVADHLVQEVGFLFLGLTIGGFSAGMQSARRRAEAHVCEAVRRRHELEQEVSRRKQLEQELQRQAGELAEADRRKDEFLAMLGHELRNPLAPIRNAVHILRSLGLADPKLQWARDVIDRQVGHLVHLVDDLLDVSRISRGKIVLRKEPVALAKAVERALEISRPLLEARGHQLSVVLPAEKLWLDADPTRLPQVLANLLNNAGKYTQEGGRIRLTAERQGGDAVLRIADNGVGIAAEMLPRIFEPFAQAEQTLDRSDGGLGIGLTLVKSLVELHGGTVEAFSEGLGKGSEFVVRVPIVHAPGEPSVNGSPAASPALAGRRVLIVDDNVDAAESLAMLLTAQGHQVHTAYDGPAALEMASTFQPEVVLLDIGLPRIDGYEVARRLRQEEGLKKTLLVAVTGYGQEEDRLRADEAGFDAHLVKPADLTALQQLLS